MKGNAEIPENANGIWLLNFRWAMDLAQRTGGRMIQVYAPPGLSDMQVAEAQMAADKGIPVVRVDGVPTWRLEVRKEDLEPLHQLGLGERTEAQKAEEEAAVRRVEEQAAKLRKELTQRRLGAVRID